MIPRDVPARQDDEDLMADVPDTPPPPRRARLTLRCLSEDLGLAIPPVTESIEATAERADLAGHGPMVAKFFEMAPVAPQNQDRVLAIRDRLVFRFKFVAYRVATWVDPESNVVWMLAAALRRADSDDAYDYFEALHNAGRLLPDRRDAARDLAEVDTRLLRAVTQAAPDLIEQAAGAPGEEVATLLAETISVAVLMDSSQDVIELWVAVSHKRPDESFLDDEIVFAVFAIFQAAVGAEEWEQQADWPTRKLNWFEVARLYVV